MDKVFQADRLGKELVVKDGRSQFLITGNIYDSFFTDTVTGVCEDMEQALMLFGRINRYDIVMVVDINDDRTPLRFALPEMREQYDAIVSGKTTDDSGTAWEDESFASSGETGSQRQNATAAATSRVTSTSATRLTLEFEKILNRLIPAKYKSLVIVKNAERILQYNQTGGLTAESQRQLETVRNWVKQAKPGHFDTATVLLIDDSHFANFENYSKIYAGGAEALTKTIRVGLPDCREIEALLIRIQCRYGLLGNPNLVATSIYAESQNKNNEMRNIVATIVKRMSGSPKPASLEELFDDELADKRRKALAEAEKELADLIGLETVRKKVEELKNFATRLQRQREAGEPPSDRTLHSLLVGNPGTGKTVVARILAKLYFGLGIRRSPEVVEISAADVSSQYLNKGTVNLRKKIQEASGGVLFIDEIYQFSKDSELQKAFENVLMKYMEDHRDDITVLGAGYKEKLSDIFRINPGVESRFYHPDNTIVFPDYSVEELMQIADMMLQKERRTLTTKAREKMFEYIKSREQLGGIGNGRGVRKLIDQILSNADTLCPHGDIDDEAVPDPVKFNEIEARKILGEMNERLMGLDRLKKHLEMLLITQEDKLDRKCFDHSTQHLALLGNPGTGKTTAVEYMARFFHAVGITSRASVVLCDVARDLSNASQVRNKFDEALGGVLFIDEAYRLAKTHAGQQAIHQIVQMMTEKNYRDLVIIIAGYTDKMQKVFNANPGLADRFKEHILFDNFTNQELERIFVNALKRGGFHIPNSEESFQQTLYQEFGKLRNNPRFANARTIEKYFQEVSTRRAARCRNDSNANRFAILTDDLKSSIDVKESLDDILAELDRDFIGLQSVKAQIREMATLLERKIKSKQIAEKQFFNLQFRGNPGTGKTTIARYMARIYNALGLIEGTEIIEQAALTLQGSFLGQTKDGVLKVFEDARTQHKLLFLDEAHALYSPGQIQQDQFSLQVIKTIVSEDTAIYNQKVFTILGGYTDGMKHLMNADVGLSRRFPTIIDFPDYTIDDCLIILDKHLHKNMFQYASSQHEDIKRRLRLIIEDMKKSPHFGNAGAMKNLGEKIIARCKSSDTITLEDLENLSMT